MAIDFIPGSEYTHLCKACQDMIDQLIEMYRDDLLPDTDDIEAPSMYMYDHRMYCGGDTCVNKPKV